MPLDKKVVFWAIRNHDELDRGELLGNFYRSGSLNTPVCKSFTL